MKKRLLAFLLAFAMMLSLVPVTAFAAEGEATPRYTDITTESGESVTVEYVETLTGESMWADPINTPYYHVTIPEGTLNVLVTYPEDVSLYKNESDENEVGFFCRYSSTNEESRIDYGEYVPVVVNEDGSKTVTIPVDTFLRQADGSGYAIGIMYCVDSESKSAAEFFDFVYAAKPHTVTLTAGEGYTLTGEASVTSGSDYTFTVAISEGYEKEDTFAVKANGGALTAGEDGSYTVANVTADLTITVEGVKKTEVPAKAGLSSLKFGDGNSASKAGSYEISPAFDPAVKEYTLLVADNFATAYAWAVRGADMSSSAKITAQWTSVDDGSAKSVALTSGKSTGQVLTKFMKTGDVTNTATFTVTDGDFTDTYTVKLVRTNPSLTALSLDGVQFSKSFSANTREYTANTAKDSVTVKATPRAESYNVTYNGKTENTVALELGENTIEVVVTNASGYTGTYTIKVTRVEEVTVDFALMPADAKVTVKDSLGGKVAPEDGKYHLMSGAEYSYLVQKDGYISQKNNFTLSQSGTIEIALDVATGNPGLDKTIYAQWGNFRNGDNNLGITNAKTPYAPEDAELLWAKKYGSGWSAAPGSPIIVDGDIVTYSGTTVKRLNRMTGEVVAEGTMVGSGGFGIIPMTYADGMLFVGLSGGTIQAFNAKTLESLWVYTDELGGQPNCPITYKNGYVYAGFWNSETKDANFVCINTIDEKHDETNEAKYASWSYTRTGGFYWAGAYATDQFVVVGTDDGTSGTDSETASLLVFDRLTGELIDHHDGIRGDIRSNISHDPSSDRVFFTSKGGVLCNAKIDWSTGKITDFKQTVITNAAGSQYAMSTSTPSVYNGRIYIGVSGNAQFGDNSGHTIAVYDLNSDGSMTKAYAYALIGYPQTSAMVTTAYASTDGYVYIYLPYNATPCGVSVLKDRKGQTAPLTTTDSGYSEVFTPVGVLAQYGICSTVADEYGTIYYKNDSCYVMAITSKIESLEIAQYPVSITENEDGTVKADGLKVVTKLKNGEERDVTNYVTVAKNEETGGYVVSYTYGFDDANYGLKTLTADIVDYKVTLPEGEGYTVTGETTVHGGENYSFTVAVAEGYEKTEAFAVKANDEVLTAAEDGTYTVEKVSADLTITVEGVAKKALEPVTVYFSLSHDADYVQCDETGEVMALKKIEVPYFDLANYGLEKYYFHSESYGAADPANPGAGSALTPGTAEFAYGKVTLLHLYIYALEVYYCGIDPAEAGQGYLKNAGLMDTELFRHSGDTGSLYLNNFWNFDENLNYYLNYAYPLASEGWGSTCDQILLHDEDIITVGHFSEWYFWSDSAGIFNYIESNNVAPVQGDKITLSLSRAGGGMTSPDGTTIYATITSCPDVYYLPADDVNTGVVSTWIPIGTADGEGKLTVDTSSLAPGEYIFAMAGQLGEENPDSICSTPGGVRVTVQAKPALKGDVNGDGIVDVFDVTTLFNAISQDAEVDASVADMNDNGIVDVFDVMAIYAFIQSGD